MQFILASSSPRRQALLKDLKVSFRILSPDINEKKLKGEPAVQYAKRVAFSKALAAAHSKEFLPTDFTCNSFIEENRTRKKCQSIKIPCNENWAILSADTIVVFQNKVIGKPTNRQDAYETLKKLSGKTHEVITAYCWLVCEDSELQCALECIKTKVTFAEKDPQFWRWYSTTDEPMDKAGSYAAQGIGMSFIEKIQGSYSNVVGLPVSNVIQSFNKNFKKDFHKAFYATN